MGPPDTMESSLHDYILKYCYLGHTLLLQPALLYL